MSGRVLFAQHARSWRLDFAHSTAIMGFIAGQLPGIVSVNSAPASRDVECRHRVSRRVIAVVRSGADGTYRFDGLPAVDDEYDLIGRDYTGTYNDVIVSRVRPKRYE